MADPQRLVDRSAIVTGSSRGIGRAVALALASEGACVVVNGRSAGAAEDVAASIREGGGRAVARVGSVADSAFARDLVDTCVDAFGSIDILVNCAGVGEPEGSSILDVSEEAWRELLETHLSGTFHCCRHAAPRMVAQRRGSIVNTSSHAYLGHYGGTAYPAAKGGTNSLTYAIAAELREHGVRANAVCPGARTRLSSGPAYERRIRDLHARGLLGDAARDASLRPPGPEHVAPLYVLLASDLAIGVTGRLFSAHGGSVGVHAPGREALLAHRDVEREGPWPLERLAEKVLAGLLA
jgi:3-oxoacyl-[acyl-carrier protein] reductase